MDIKIRTANVGDVSSIIELLVKWRDETTFKCFPKANNQILNWLTYLFNSGLVIVAEVDGEVAGTLGMKYDYFAWNNEVKLLMCEFFMVEKQYRAGGVAQKLLEYIKEASHEIQAPVLMGVNVGYRAEQKDRFLQMCGFTYAGGNFIYGV